MASEPIKLDLEKDRDFDAWYLYYDGRLMLTLSEHALITLSDDIGKALAALAATRQRKRGEPWHRASDSVSLSEHLKRLCDCLSEAVEFAQQVSPETGHNAGVWETAIREALSALQGAP
ncbi:MAG: hypothetical protein BWY63_03922 [Chloroflexi bacterium ADurb.Bin360]|nr:MAG: hypothetical protein BWY63_03922 [Chloroflexi bacterium ADurb.Bin360]